MRPLLLKSRIRSTPSSPEALLRTGSTWSPLPRRPAHLKIKKQATRMRLHAASPREPNFRKREGGGKKLTVQAAERPRPVVPDEPGQQVGGEEDEPVRVPGPQGLPPQGLAPAAAPARLRASCLGHGHFRPAARSSRRRCSRAEAWSAPSSPARLGAGVPARSERGRPC